MFIRFQTYISFNFQVKNFYIIISFNYLIKFLERILGALTAAPSKEAPVIKIPLIFFFFKYKNCILLF